MPPVWHKNVVLLDFTTMTDKYHIVNPALQNALHNLFFKVQKLNLNVTKLSSPSRHSKVNELMLPTNQLPSLMGATSIWNFKMKVSDVAGITTKHHKVSNVAGND